jgi:hypothetical protein
MAVQFDCDLVQAIEHVWQTFAGIVRRVLASVHRTHLVVCKVLKQRGFGFGLMIQEDLKYFTSSFIVQFLGIPRIGDWFLLGRVD